jgi:hypothetical protein
MLHFYDIDGDTEERTPWMVRKGQETKLKPILLVDFTDLKIPAHINL